MKDSVRRFVLLKLTTVRREASRGLFATAELLVYVSSSWGYTCAGLFYRSFAVIFTIEYWGHFMVKIIRRYLAA